MKYMVISDIHGGIDELNTALEIYRKEQCSKLLLLGDLFSYDYYLDDSRVMIANRLNLMKDDIIAVRGNCDNDLTNVRFEMEPIKEIELNGQEIVMTHGHLYTENQLLEMNKDIIYIGHTHREKLVMEGDTLLANPGSVAKSRDDENSFAIVDEELITVRNLNNEVIDMYYLNNNKVKIKN